VDDTKETVGGTRSLERALRLLREVAGFDMRGARLTDLVSRSGLETSTAHRMLKRLVASGLLDKDARGRYHLGRQTFELGLLAARRYDMRDAAVMPMRRVADVTGDVVFLTMRSGLDMVCLDRREGEYPIQVLSMAPGTRRPIGFGAGGVALLGAMRTEEADEVLRVNESRYRAFGPQVPARVRQGVETARRLGYGLSESHLTGGITGIGVVVPTDSVVPFLSISVVAMGDRLTGPRRDDAVEALREAARSIAETVDRRPDASAGAPADHP
jgi:DNA-binding IclR family transcriptional regulator